MKKKFFTKDYTLLWLGMAISQLGVGAGNIGIMWWIQTTTGSAILLGTMAMLRTLINVLLSPFGGVFADKFNKKAIIVLGDVFRGIVYGLLSYFIYVERLTPALMLTLIGCSAVCSTFFNPAISATVPLLVLKENLPRANSLQQITSNLVTIAGYAVGGILVASLGVPLLLAINAAAFLLSALSEMFIIIPQLVTTAKTTHRQFWRDLKEGFVYAKQNRVLIDIMKVAALLNLVTAPIFILLPKYVQENLGGSSALYGYLLAAFTIGNLIASLIIAFTKMIQRNLWLVVHSLTPQAVVLISIALMPAHWHAARVGLLLLMGFFNGIINIYFAAVVQRTTAPEQMGRVWGLINTMSGGLQPLGQGLTGFLGDYIAIPIIYLASGALEGVAGVVFSRIPGLRSYLAAEESKDAMSTAELSSSHD